MSQTNFFSSWTIPLPDEEALSRNFQALNERYFAGTLPPTVIRWSKRMRIAGTCDTRQRIITLSRSYHTHFPDDIEDTLKHEMIHLRHRKHDAAFRKEAARIGTSVHCKDYPGLHPRARHVYMCPKCKTLFHRTKVERLYCGRCSRRGLDPAFMLVLLSQQDHQRAVRSLAAQRPIQTRPPRLRRWRRACRRTLNLF